MNYNHSGRLWLIAFVLYTALSCIFPDAPGSLFWVFEPSKTSFKADLKPGIDMVGGTSLTYEIKQPEGGYHGEGTLAEAVATALKKRVDPDGVRNLVWRPQGNTQLEIQLPRGQVNEDATRIRDAYLEAQSALDATNVRSPEVVRTVESLKGEDRDNRLTELAAGNAARLDLFKQLAIAFDELQKARGSGNVDAEAQAELAYDALKPRVDATNTGVAELEAILAQPVALRQKQLDALKAGATPERVTAINVFTTRFDEFAKVRDKIDDAAALKRLLRGSGMLEFHILVEPTDPGYAAMVQRLQSDGPRLKAGDRMRWYETERVTDFLGSSVEHGGKHYVLAWTTPDKSMTNPPGQQVWALTSAVRSQDDRGGSAVGFSLDPQGGVLFGTLTGSNRGQQLAIVLDNKIVSSANIESQIQGSGIISRRGGYPPDELRYLLSTLNAGSLPATLAEEPISERTVGPQLGADNLRRGLLACVLGLAVVAAFLTAYYYLAGVVAAFAVVMNVVLILATMAAIDATFTLPGIAGIVLTIGAAVDANVLIFERLREEQLRGVGIKRAISNAYDRAASAIIDSNATTLITAVILVLLGTEEVKGFGVTLLIGLVWSLFTSLYVTRTVLELLADRFDVRKYGSIPMTIPTWDRLLKPNIDWMGKAWVFMLFSALFITLGIAGVISKLNQGQLLDVEFTKGTAVQFELKQPMNIERVRERIEKTPLPSPSVVAVGTDEQSFEVITPEENTTKVRESILSAMQNGDDSLLDIETPSFFDGVKDPIDLAMRNNVVLPIGSDPIRVDGFEPANVENYRGGVAIVLKNLSPRRTPGELSERIRRHLLQPRVGESTVTYTEFTVVSPAGPNTPTDLAVVLVAPGNFPYSDGASTWTAQLAAPIWSAVVDSVNSESQLQSVRSIDPSVASNVQEMAIWALVLSVAVIMVYVWLRFGNLKYGTATVLAMAHDTLLAVGSVGLAHYIWQWMPSVANVLLIEPFRVNLTMVAGILTVMSYSMIDTIVVFDRIRENRGNAPLNRRVVNDSINQTLSRTLLTVATTVATLLGMYVFGGPGIHGFTFVLLIGILVGTYSSIAIAAPFLLIGAKRDATDTGKSAIGQLQRV